MKSVFFKFIFVMPIMIALPAHSAVYGVCCAILPKDCVSPLKFQIQDELCKCVCPEGSSRFLEEGNYYCCKGAYDILTEEITYTCCEENTEGEYVTLGGNGIRTACCVKNSSKNIDGKLDEICCYNAGGAIRGTGDNQKCCRQSSQNS